MPFVKERPFKGLPVPRILKATAPVKMTMQTNPDTYVLSHRRDNAEEHQRLGTQHGVIKHAILDGVLIHPSIGGVGPNYAIADLGCGTGAWLEDVAKTYFANEDGKREVAATLIGFDINTHAFAPNMAPGIQLVEHDCTRPFDSPYIGKFDLVNIRGLAFALSRTTFPSLIEHAVQLLSQLHFLQNDNHLADDYTEPGGYLQWLETESQLWKAHPKTAEISKILDTINIERRQRDLVPNLPQFMLRQLLSLNPDADILPSPNKEFMTITSFNLLPGGISREAQSQDTTLNRRFSATVLESMKLILDSMTIRKKSQISEKSRSKECAVDRDSSAEEIQQLMAYLDNIRESGKIMTGGYFPQIIARKAICM
ncbi:MAG: hypothetical protein Q9221_002641 [Calogaya cf. arnoldii]